MMTTHNPATNYSFIVILTQSNFKLFDWTILFDWKVFVNRSEMIKYWKCYSGKIV